MLVGARRARPPPRPHGPAPAPAPAPGGVTLLVQRTEIMEEFGPSGRRPGGFAPPNREGERERERAGVGHAFGLTDRHWI